MFNNWDPVAQALVGDSLPFEQCAFKAFETDAPYMTHDAANGRCTCFDAGAVLAPSATGGISYANLCHENQLGALTAENNGAFEVLPNPTASEAILRFGGASPEGRVRRISLFAGTGVLLKSILSAEPTVQLDLSGLPAGFYLLSVDEGGSRRVAKLVKN